MSKDVLDEAGECVEMTPLKIFDVWGINHVVECKERLERLIKEAYSLPDYKRRFVLLKLQQAHGEIKKFLEAAERPSVKVEVGELKAGEKFGLYILNQAPVECEVDVVVKNNGRELGRSKVYIDGGKREFAGYYAAERGKLEVLIEASWPRLRKKTSDKYIQEVAEKKETQKSEEYAKETPTSTRPEYQPREPRPAVSDVQQAASPGAETRAPLLGVTWADLLTSVLTHGVAAALGFQAGRLMPEVKKVEKPIFVASGVPYVRSGGVTYILADPLEVVVEDMGEHLYVRWARTVEVVSQVSVKAAERLAEDFRQRFLRAHTGWKVKEKRSRSGVVLRATKGFFRRLAVTAAVYMRVERLESRKVDHEPADIGVAIRELGLEKHLTGVVVIASPTGWTSQSLEQAVRSKNIMLVDLKTGEAYCGEELRDLANALGYSPPGAASVLIARDEKCDHMLVEGDIDEKTYLALVRKGSC